MTTKTVKFQGQSVSFEKTNLKRGGSDRILWELTTKGLEYEGYKALYRFQTDFTSAPWWAGIFWLLIKVYWTKLMIPTFFHDQACQDHINFPDKKKADELFFELMGKCGIPFFMKYPMYWYVSRGNSKRVMWQQPNLIPVMDSVGLIVAYKEPE